jgi:hypothetical protein
MKLSFLLFAGLFVGATAYAGDDATEITKKLRSEFSGEFITKTEGVVRSATLNDGRVIIEAEGDLAKYLLYNLSQAPDLVEYQPRQGPASYLNYFIRQGSDLVCGLNSYDLKLDPLPKFKCRFVVDSYGNVSAFTDRADIPYRDEPFTDFFYSELSETTSSASAYNFIRFNNPEVSFQLQFYGKVAQSLFTALTQAEKFKGGMGPYIKTDVRLGKSIWCLTMSSPDGYSNDPEKAIKCRVQFGFEGKSSQDYPKD